MDITKYLSLENYLDSIQQDIEFLKKANPAPPPAAPPNPLEQDLPEPGGMFEHPNLGGEGPIPSQASAAAAVPGLGTLAQGAFTPPADAQPPETPWHQNPWVWGGLGAGALGAYGLGQMAYNHFNPQEEEPEDPDMALRQ